MMGAEWRRRDGEAEAVPLRREARDVRWIMGVRPVVAEATSPGSENRTRLLALRGRLGVRAGDFEVGDLVLAAPWSCMAADAYRADRPLMLRRVRRRAMGRSESSGMVEYRIVCLSEGGRGDVRPAEVEAFFTVL